MTEPNTRRAAKEHPTTLARLTLRWALEAGWAPLLVLGVYVASGAGNLFGHEPFVGPTMHVAGGAAATYFLRRGAELAGAWLGHPNALALDLLAVGGCCGSAILWELGEYFSDQYLGTHAQLHIDNAMKDLLFGVIGGALFVIVSRLVGRRDSPGRVGGSGGIP
jgi:hypothetical protein